MSNFNGIFNECSKAFNQNRIAEKVKNLAYGLLTCYGRHTITGMLTGCGKQFVDWSSTYRIFSQNRIRITELYNIIIKTFIKQQVSCEYIVAHMDDTLIRKTGKKIPGTSWKRDPLGPPFHTNFVWGQRYLQISLALASKTNNCQSRAIPVDFHHCPTASKPNKSATHEQIDEYKKVQKELKLSKQGSLRIKALRESLDNSNAADKQLIISVDGSYTNDEVLKNMPKRTTLIGRIRKDTKLFSLPAQSESTGRKRVYGDRIPTPEAIRQDDKIVWTKVEAWAAGKTHSFSIKVLNNLKWKSAGQNHLLQLIVIRPLGYRLTKGAKMLYRQAAYLICTDNNLEIEKLLQAYLWRWEIEVNFRDEKTILGCGQAQVRNENAVKNLPAFTTAIYSIIHLAGNNEKLIRGDNILPKAKWDKVTLRDRLSTSEIINLFRCQLWSQNNTNSFNDFVKKQADSKRLQIFENPFTSAMFYVRK